MSTEVKWNWAGGNATAKARLMIVSNGVMLFFDSTGGSASYSIAMDNKAAVEFARMILDEANRAIGAAA